MKPCRLIATILLGSFLAPGLASMAQDGEKGMLPVSRPHDLWEVMPGKMKTWELKESTAESRYDRWLEAQAVRKYEKIQEPVEAGEEAKPPALTRIAITDTAGYPDSIAFFDNFDPEAEEEEEESGIERRMIAGWPTFLITYEDDQELVVEMLVARRFLVEISMKHQPKRFVAQWVNRLDLRELAAIPKTDVVDLPETVKVMRVDQLNPDRNMAYLLATTSNTRLEQELEEDEAWLRGVIGEIPELSDPAASTEAGEPGEDEDDSDGGESSPS